MSSTSCGNIERNSACQRLTRRTRSVRCLCHFSPSADARIHFNRRVLGLAIVAVLARPGKRLAKVSQEMLAAADGCIGVSAHLFQARFIYFLSLFLPLGDALCCLFQVSLVCQLYFA